MKSKMKNLQIVRGVGMSLLFITFLFLSGRGLAWLANIKNYDDMSYVFGILIGFGISIFFLASLLDKK